MSTLFLKNNIIILIKIIKVEVRKGGKALLFSKPLKLDFVGVLALLELLLFLFSYIEDDIIIPVVAMLDGLGLRGPDSLIFTEEAAVVVVEAVADGVSTPPPPLIALGERPENLGHKWPSLN